MKSTKMILGLLILTISSASATYAQQQFTQTVTSANKSCNATCTVLDIPALNNNPGGIIFVTPVLVNGVNLNSHPIGAYYMYLNKWSIFNLDATAIAVGAQFNVEYYANSDANHFVFVIPQLVQSNTIAYIDHAGLNNNPNAQILAFPTSPPSGGALFNRSEIRIVYEASAGKWLLANNNNASLAAGAAYNIMFPNGPTLLPTSTQTGTLVPLPTATPNPAGQQGTAYLPRATLAPPAASSPNGSAGGDLNGNYPNPKVIGLQGKPMSTNAPIVGQVLRWNGAAWEPGNEATGGSTYNAGTGLAIQGSTIYANNTAPMWNANQIAGHAVSNTAPAVGQILRWNGTAWEPAADNVGSASQTSATVKPSALVFKQSAVATINAPNVNSLPIPGLNNQTFTLAQSSRVVFHTAIDIRASTVNIIDPGATGVWLSVEILSASNAVVAKSTSDAVLGTWVTHSINSSGIGILPAGTYHTRVLINRQAGGAMLDVTGGFGDHPSQGGQMILEIFPD